MSGMTANDQDPGAETASAATVTTPDPFLSAVGPASTFGIGSLPHRGADAAARLSMEAFDVLTLPSLPRRSPAESPIAQALVGTPGVTLGQYGTVAIDVARLDPAADVRTEWWRDAFVGFRTTIELARAEGYTGPVKWQFVGPISVGLALRRAGARPEIAFPMARRAVRCHLASLSSAISSALPASPQLVVIDEPFLDDLMSHDFPIAPDEAADLLSSAMAAVEPSAATGVHSCGATDLAPLLAAGPTVLSIPVRPTVSSAAGYLDRFLRAGGRIAWGAVPTEGPIGSGTARTIGRLHAAWSALAERGCDADLLRRQSFVTPQCGLGSLSTSVAERVCEATGLLSQAVRST